MKNALKEIYSGVKSLAIGMKITIGQFFKPTITVQYPHETLKIPPRFRGHIELVLDPETGRAKCYACKLCERACPSDCITVEGVKLEGAKKKSVSHYVLDFTKCSLCGSCVEACRDDAIRYSHEYNLASVNKDDFVMDLFKRLEEQARQNGFEPTAPAPPPAAPAAAKPALPATASAPTDAAAPVVTPSLPAAPAVPKVDGAKVPAVAPKVEKAPATPEEVKSV
jgi:NADH-quinone oxidoreductase subunit I